MKHPITLIRHYDDDVQNGRYRKIGDKEVQNWIERRETFESDYDYEKALMSAVGNLWATKARLIDKIALYKEIIARGAGLDQGSISDDDALMILAGWSSEMRQRTE